MKIKMKLKVKMRIKMQTPFPSSLFLFLDRGVLFPPSAEPLTLLRAKKIKKMIDDREIENSKKNE